VADEDASGRPSRPAAPARPGSDEARAPDQAARPESQQEEGSEASGDGGGRGFVVDAVRKAVLTGLGAVFLTEEGARKLAREWKLPKEIVGYVVGQAGGAKDEVVRVVNDEVRKFFRSEALRREFLRLLSSMSIEVRAEIRLKPGEGGEIRTDIKIPDVKRTRSAPEEEREE
jgi:hypothetical protein